MEAAQEDMQEKERMDPFAIMIKMILVMVIMTTITIMIIEDRRVQEEMQEWERMDLVEKMHN